LAVDKLMQAGDLKYRVGFYGPDPHDDGFGNTIMFNDTPDFIVSAAMEPKLGGETVLAGRLAGRNLINVTVRSSEQTRSVKPEWKAKDERTGDDLNIRSIIDPDQQRQWLEMLCEKGVAA
jgi:head-tail adaptor